MDIVTEDTHRLLMYIEAVNRRGAALTTEHAEEYARQPDVRAKYKPGPLDVMASLSRSLQGNTVPAESWLDYLSRLGWATETDGLVRLTRLGRALLRDLNTPDSVDHEQQEATTITLDPSDPFAYTKAISAIADLGPAMLVDPYFRFEQLETVVESTEINRILTSKKIGAKAPNQLALALAVLEPEERPEVRITASFHDRFLVPDSGPVTALGVSLNGVGRNISVVVPLGVTAGDAIRATHEELWSGATIVEPKSPPKSSSSED